MTPPLRSALGIAGVYFVLAALWIVFSDRAVEVLWASPDARATAQTVKGLVFIAGSTLVVGALVYRDAWKRHELESRCRSVLDQSLVGIYVVREHRFLFVNRRLADMLGYDPGELVRERHPRDVIAPEEWEEVAEQLRARVRGEREEVRQVVTGVRKDGERIRAEVHGRRMLWEGEPAVLGVVVDITERERLEALEWQHQRLETLGQLTGAVVHDFRNLLTAIAAPLELALGRLAPHHAAREDLEEARAGTDRAVALTQELLAFCRGRAHRPRPVDLGELVRAMAPMLRRFGTDGVEVRLELAEGLPAVRLDPVRFEQVLVNLVVNGVQAVESSGTVSVRTRRADEGNGRAVVLEVEDDGRGMDETTLGRLFEPFYTTKPDGTGLGLATVHGIVTQAGGEIGVTSRPGRGSTFQITLPATPEEALPVNLDAPPEDDEVAVWERGGVVLVVDDEEAIRRVVARALERNGYEVVTAASAEAALELVEKHGEKIDLVLTDVVLPDMRGPELALRVEELLPRARVIYMSGHHEEEVMARIGQRRESRFVEKPFSVEALLQEVSASFHQGAETGEGVEG